MFTSETTFLLCTREDPELDWLQGSLGALGRILRTDNNLDEITRLIDVMNVPAVFIGIDRHQQVQQCALIESLLGARPLVAIIAIGDGFDSELVIAAMRAGARDFITIGLRGSEVLGLVRRQLSRLPQLPQQSSSSSLTVICGAQPDVDGALVATHLALELADSGSKVLLIDLGLPEGESKAILGLESNFHFEDAMRNLRRMDTSVIDSAFAQHSSGLHLLALADAAFPLAQANSAEIFLLLSSLKQHFNQIVVNLCGQPDSTLVRALVGSASHLLWHTDQSVPCSHRSLLQLQRWRAEGVKVDHAELVVDRYIPKQSPSAQMLAKAYEMPLAASLPLSAGLRLACRNEGQSLYELGGHDALPRALGKLAQQINQRSSTRSRSFWQRLRGF